MNRAERWSSCDRHPTRPRKRQQMDIPYICSLGCSSECLECKLQTKGSKRFFLFPCPKSCGKVLRCRSNSAAGYGFARSTNSLCYRSTYSGRERGTGLIYCGETSRISTNTGGCTSTTLTHSAMFLNNSKDLGDSSRLTEN